MTLYNFCWWWEIFKFIPEIFPTLRQKIWNSKSFSSEFHVIVIHFGDDEMGWEDEMKTKWKKCHRLGSSSTQYTTFYISNQKGFALKIQTNIRRRQRSKMKFMFCAVGRDFLCTTVVNSLFVIQEHLSTSISSLQRLHCKVSYKKCIFFFFSSPHS